MIDFRRGSTAIVGMTRSGKTYTAVRYMTKEKRGVLFFNTQYEDLPSGWLKADGNTDTSVLKRALRAGEKINFLPNIKNRAQGRRQLAALIDLFFDQTKHNMIFAVDEVHLYNDKECLNGLIQLATTGQKWGITLVPITQRLARLDNTLMTQCLQKIVFYMEDEAPYFKTYNIPYAEIQKRILAKDNGKNNKPYPIPHSYCSYYLGQVEGAYKLGC